VDADNPEPEIISYNRKDIACELCKEKFPDYIKIGEKYYNISFYKPKFKEFLVMESMKADKHKVKFIYIISFDKKNSINIGRANECDLSVSELSVSRFHCIIHKEEDDIYLEDNSSKFGTLILIQNHNLLMNDYQPLRVQTDKTFIKFKIKLPFTLSCCRNPLMAETIKYDYQIQNRKCFDIFSYFIMKENDTKLEVEDDEEVEKKDKVENNVIKAENKDKEENKKDNEEEDQKVENANKVEVNNNNNLTENEISKSARKEDSMELNADKKSVKSEMVKQGALFETIIHTNRLKKICIKKGINDSKELPELDKINLEHFKESISLMAEKEEKFSQGAGHPSKTINLIKLNKKDKIYDNLNSNNIAQGTTINTRPVVSFQTIMNENNHAVKKDEIKE
jgi:pSer/pThr/pTyr-binding forkhead associated (FHA) protein